MTFKIEKGVPLPIKKPRGDLSNALQMLMDAEIGDSIFIATGSLENFNSVLNTIRARRWQIGGPGWAASRKETNGVRVWKIAEPQRFPTIAKEATNDT